MDGGQVMLATCYTIDQIVEATGRSQATIYRDIKAGKLSAHKLGREWRVTQSEFDAYVRGERYDESKRGMAFEDVLASVSAAVPLMNNAERVRLMQVIVSNDADRIAQAL